MYHEAGNDSRPLLYIICRSDKHDAIGCDLGPQGRTTLLEASRHVSRGVGLGWSGPFTRARPLRAIKPGAHSPCPFACTWTRRLVESSRAAAGKAISGCSSWPLARLHLACLALATHTCCELEMRTRPPALAGEGRRLQLTNIRVCVCLCAGRAEDPEVAVAVASASHRVCPDVAPSQQRSAAALCVACSQGVSRHGLAWSRGRPPPPFLRSYAPCRDCNRTGTRHACMYTKYGT